MDKKAYKIYYGEYGHDCWVNQNGVDGLNMMILFI